MANKTKIPVGTVLASKYRVTREIGRGGMAAVYEAANVDIGKRVAIKVLAQELTTSQVVVERFLREARAAAAIRSPYICDVYDSGRLDDGRPFLVLELLEGDSLYERMTKIRWLDADTTVSIVTQVCRGLTKAHAANIVHRDLKPENIFLTKDEEGELLSKILDFGLAKFYAPVDEAGVPQPRLTREGAVFGTPAYMSPEQVRGQGAVDHRADLWALGCIVYECFTGRTVWATDQGVAMTFAQIANAELPRPQAHRPDLPDGFTAWFERALNRDITKRFQSAKEFSDDFALVWDRSRADRASLASLASPRSSPSLPKVTHDGVTRDGLDAPPSAPRDAPFSAAAPGSASAAKAGAIGSSAKAGASASSHEPGLEAGELIRAADPSTTASLAKDDPSGRASVAPPPRRTGRVAAGLLGAALVAGGAALAWSHLRGAESDGAPKPGPSSSTDPSASASDLDGSVKGEAPSGSAETPRVPTATTEASTLPWYPLVRDGQQAIASGDLAGAVKLIKEASERSGGHGVPHTMLEHLNAVLLAGDQPCKLTGLGRPRTYDLVPGGKSVASGRPTLAVGPRGAVVAWADAHDGLEQVYAVALDDALRDRGAPTNVAPEWPGVTRPSLLAVGAVGDRFVLSYVDTKGAEPGVHARLLDADGHVAAGSVAIAGAKSAGAAPVAVNAPDGFIFGWTEEADGDSEDLFFRQLGPKLELSGPSIRATDLVAGGPTRARVRSPSLAIGGGVLLASFRYERDPLRLIEHLRIPLADLAKGGVSPPNPADKKAEKKADKNIGEMVLVNTDKGKTESPSLACGGGSCFLAWSSEGAGLTWVAYVDPAVAQPIVRRHVAKQSQRVAVAVNAKGQGQLVWFDKTGLYTAAVTKDNVGKPSKIARISSEQSAPVIAAGNAQGEWFVAWHDYETGHLEPYVARVLCK